MCSLGSLYHNIQLSDPVFVQLVRNLAPAQLRIGGSASDSLWYVPNGTAGPGPSPDPLSPMYGNYTAANYSTSYCAGFPCFTPDVTIITDATWRSICGFAAATGTQLLWDVASADFRSPMPAPPGGPAGAWDPAANATALLAFTAASGLSVATWELGNEPDLWPRHYGLNASGAQLAADLRTLQELAGSFGLSTAVSGPSLATFNPQLLGGFLQGWVASGGGDISVTGHSYPLGPANVASQCTASNFLNVSRASNLASWLANWVAAVQQYGAPAETRLVLEETASNSLGGCPGFSDRFISGFYWLNTMGLVAANGFQQASSPGALGGSLGARAGVAAPGGLGASRWHSQRSARRPGCQVNRQDLAGMSFTANGSQYTLFGPPAWANGSGLVPDRPVAPSPPAAARSA